MTAQQSERPRVAPAAGGPLPALRALLRPLLGRLWYVHPDTTLLVQASPTTCLRALGLTARPSTERLHLRELFRQGRRYQLYLRNGGGFRVTTTSKVLWHYRRRTTASAVLDGSFTELDSGLVQVHLSAHMRPFYLLSTFFLPLYVTSILIFIPWPLPLRLVLLSLLFGLSWLGHRANAALEAFEMVHFVRQAFAGLDAPPAPQITPTGDPGVVYDEGQAFAEAWERFYAEHRGEGE